MSDINTLEIMSVLSKLQHNYTSLAQYWYDIFYNPEPKEVSIDYYDSEGDKVVITIDNLAKIRESMGGLSGSGMPDVSLKAEFGTIYHDTETGDLYRFAKDISSADDTAGFWDKIITSDILDSIIVKNDDPIENKVAVTNGVLYLGRDTQKLYIGRNGAWERIDAAPSLAARQEFQVESGDTRLVTNGLVLSTACESPNTLKVYVDGVLMNADKYSIKSNGFVLKFKEAIISPEEGKSVDIIVTYFTNLSLYEEYWDEEEVTLEDGTVVHHKNFKFAKDLFEALQDITNRLAGLLAESTDMQTTLDGLKVEIEDLRKDLTHAVEITVGDITKEVKAISDGVKNDRSAILTLHNSVKNWYDQVSTMRNEIASTQTDISDDVLWLKQIFTDPTTGQIDLKKFVFIDDFKSAMDAQQNDYTNKITELRTSLTTRINNSDGRIEVLEADVKDIEDRVDANEAGITSLNETVKNTEAQLRKDCFSEKNFPVDFMTSIKNNKNLNSAIKSLGTTTEGATPKYGIELEISRDFSYYTIDLTDDLTQNGADKIYKQFTIINKLVHDDIANTDYNIHNDYEYVTGFEEELNLEKVIPGDTIVDGDYKLACLDYDANVEIVRTDKTHYEVGTMFNITGNTSLTFRVEEEIPPTVRPTEDTYVVQGRVLLINKSAYRPRIIWENSGISWLGGEEPDLEAGKTYLLEFITYDYGKTWFAHTLGICQPSIYVGDIIRTFNITVNDYETSELGLSCDVFYDKEDGKTYYAGAHTIDNGGVIKDVELVFSKKELGDSFRNFRVHKSTDGLFMKHLVQGYNGLVDDELNKQTVSIDNTNVHQDVHMYPVSLTSDDFNNDLILDITFTLGRMNGSKEEVIVLDPIKDKDVYDTTTSVTIDSTSNPSVFIGADEINSTTPWYIKKVVAVHNNTYENSDTGETVISSSTTYSSNLETPLQLDERVSVYLSQETEQTEGDGE